MSIGPIPWSKIVEYGQRSGLDSATIDLLVSVIRTMDAAYLKWLADEQKKAETRSE